MNEAWTAGGMEGTINHATVSEVRKQMGLIGKVPTKTRKAAKGKAAANKAKPTGTPGKTLFVKEFLNDHPEGNVRAVNEAWNSAGFAGTISPALVHKMRASLGLTGNRRGATKKSKHHEGEGDSHWQETRKTSEGAYRCRRWAATGRSNHGPGRS